MLRQQQLLAQLAVLGLVLLVGECNPRTQVSVWRRSRRGSVTTAFFLDGRTGSGAVCPSWPPVDTYRVTATGGPPTVGGTGSGWLSDQVIGPGDATVTTAWFDVHPEAYPYLPGRDLAATWNFGTTAGDDPRTTTSYDVASFTVEYRRYVPMP